MFKKIVKSIAAIKTENDRDECYWQIDRAFEEERISFEDHELLYGLAGMVEVAYFFLLSSVPFRDVKQAVRPVSGRRFLWSSTSTPAALPS